MTSLVERLRVRSDRKPLYHLDESDDDVDFVQGKPGATQEKFERIVRDDAVCCLLILLLDMFVLLGSIFFFFVPIWKFF